MRQGSTWQKQEGEAEISLATGLKSMSQGNVGVTSPFCPQGRKNQGKFKCPCRSFILTSLNPREEARKSTAQILLLLYNLPWQLFTTDLNVGTPQKPIMKAWLHQDGLTTYSRVWPRICFLLFWCVAPEQRKSPNSGIWRSMPQWFCPPAAVHTNVSLSWETAGPAPRSYAADVTHTCKQSLMLVSQQSRTCSARPRITLRIQRVLNRFGPQSHIPVHIFSFSKNKHWAFWGFWDQCHWQQWPKWLFQRYSSIILEVCSFTVFQKVRQDWYPSYLNTSAD